MIPMGTFKIGARRLLFILDRCALGATPQS